MAIQRSVIGLLCSFFRFRRRVTPASVESLSANEAEAHFTRLERLLVRLQRDVERIKLHTGLVLGNDRAVALLATGDRIYVDPRDGGCGMNLLTEGKYEEDEIRLFRRFLRPGINILDIGANYGYYSIIAAPYIRPGGRIFSFEPNPHIYDLFSSSLYMNGLLDVVAPRRLGVYDSNGELRFEINESSPGGAHIVSPTDRPPPEHLVIDVPIVRLDDHLPPDLIVDLVKIDVEGHEEHVLNGMRELIGRSPDIAIFMELFAPFFADDGEYLRLMRLITDDLGFRIHRVLSGGYAQETDVAALRGEICTLILSKKKLAAAPDLTIYPGQLNKGPNTRLEGEVLLWDREGVTGVSGRMIAHGPYVFLPKGRYRLAIDADFEGEFLCRLQENFGDLLWEGRIGSCGRYEADIYLALDAPKLEIAFWSASDSGGSWRFRKAELWPVS